MRLRHSTSRSSFLSSVSSTIKCWTHCLWPSFCDTCTGILLEESRQNACSHHRHTDRRKEKASSAKQCLPSQNPSPKHSEEVLFSNHSPLSALHHYQQAHSAQRLLAQTQRWCITVHLHHVCTGTIYLYQWESGQRHLQFSKWYRERCICLCVFVVFFLTVCECELLCVIF